MKIQGAVKMGTMSEEILSAHVGKRVKAGDIVVAPVDFMMSQDGTTGLTIKAFNDMGGKKILDPSRYAIVIDHNAPSPLEGVSNIHKQMREFASKYGAKLYDVGDGVCHVLVPESGRALPGTIIIGKHSGRHTLKQVLAKRGYEIDDEVAGILLEQVRANSVALKRSLTENELVYIYLDHRNGVPDILTE